MSGPRPPDRSDGAEARSGEAGDGYRGPGLTGDRGQWIVEPGPILGVTRAIQ